MNRWALYEAMLLRKTVTVGTGMNRATGLVNGIEMEDGSGQSFIVSVLDSKTLDTRRVYVRAA